MAPALPSPPAAPTPELRTDGCSPGVCGDRVSFGETQKQGCRMPSTVPSSQTQHVWRSLDAGSRGPGMDREAHGTCRPRRAPGLGARPAFSLFHPFSPFRHPLGITVSLQTKQAEQGTAGQKRGPAGDRVEPPTVGSPVGHQVRVDCSSAGARGPAGSSASPVKGQ